MKRYQFMIVVNAPVVRCSECFDFHYQLYETKWSSENKDIDCLIKEYAKINPYFAWIPFERFTNVEYLTKGTIYKASFHRYEWDHKENIFKRVEEDKREVVLRLRNSKQIIKEVKMNNLSMLLFLFSNKLSFSKNRFGLL